MANLPWLVALALVALGTVLALLWIAYRITRRRVLDGRVTEAERRFERSLARFSVEIDRFKFARPGAVRTLMNNDHAVLTAIEREAGEDPQLREKLRLRVHRFVEEIIPAFQPLSYFGLGLRLARLLLHGLYRVDVPRDQIERLQAHARVRPRSMIYVINHRSNADYVLVAYALAEKLALSFAVGEWARVWPLEYLFKSFGSFFLRRGFRDPLYHTVLRRYVQLVTKNGVTQALFPEGGLSRDGLLRPPKIGLIDAIVCAKADRSFDRELVFVPVAINYDRVLEDRALVAERGGHKPKRRKSSMLHQVGRILFANLSKFVRRRMRKNGIAAVRLGEPISFDAWIADRGVAVFDLDKEQRRQHVADFCNHLMRAIAARVPATPLCLCARALITQAPCTRVQLIEAVDQLRRELAGKQAPIACDEHDSAWMVDGALLRFELRHMIRRSDQEISLPDEVQPILAYYANSIAHHFDGVVPEVEKRKSEHASRASQQKGDV